MSHSIRRALDMQRDKDESPGGSTLVAGLGELIWDMLPAGKQLGGAPSNFAYISRLLGNTSAVASRVGDDELGREARRRLDALGISTRYLQLDAGHPTGTVGVRIDAQGEPHFRVNEDSAWDYLAWTDAWEELAGRVDAVCFGTLGQRNTQARETMLRFLDATRGQATRVFDVNLRHSFFTSDMLAASLQLATIVKFNSEELNVASAMLGIDEGEAVASCRRLIERFDIELIAVTRGARGSLLVSAEHVAEHPGFRVRVADTIGAGDAFTATLVHYYLRGVSPLARINEAANRIGAWLATQTGATPVVSPAHLAQLLGESS